MCEKSNSIQALQDAFLANTLGKNTDFAKSLIDYHHRWGKLSDKQWYWVNKLAGCSHNETPLPPRQTVDVEPIMEMFRIVGAKLKYPKIVATLGDILLRFDVVRARDSSVLSIRIRHESSRRWLGRIHSNGQVEISRYVSEEDKEKILHLVFAFAVDPIGVASRSGKITGNCCFCVKELTDEVSLSDGYGPVCAKNYGLGRGESKDYADGDRGIAYIEMPNGKWRVRNRLIQWLGEDAGEKVWTISAKKVLEFETVDEARLSVGLAEITYS